MSRQVWAFTLSLPPNSCVTLTQLLPSSSLCIHLCRVETMPVTAGGKLPRVQGLRTSGLCLPGASAQEVWAGLLHIAAAGQALPGAARIHRPLPCSKARLGKPVFLVKAQGQEPRPVAEGLRPSVPLANGSLAREVTRPSTKSGGRELQQHRAYCLGHAYC